MPLIDQTHDKGRISLDRFGLSADSTVLIATGEPHGQIECTVGRG